MSEPTFTDEQLEDIREAIGWDDTRADVNNDNETITDILSAALAQGVVLKVESGPLSPMPCPHPECKCPYWHPTICMKCGHSVVLPLAKVEDDAIVAAVDHIRAADCPHCDAAADLLERLAAERKPEGWRSRTVSGEEWDALVPLAYQHHALDILTLLGLHRSAPKPQDEI